MKIPKSIILLCTPEPQFLLPSMAAVFVGTALGASESGNLDFVLMGLTILAMILLNAGSNMLNDYFDHLSGNDALNFNPTQFSGGSRYIQKGIIKPETMRTAGIISIFTGAIVGLIIVAITKSLFILTLGIIGFLGGLLWTAPPIKLCYRFPGEAHIFSMFGLLPTFGAYYLQTGEFSFTPLLASVIVGLHIANVALINSIPDIEADSAVDKKTFAVRFGIKNAIWLYRAFLILAYCLSMTAIFVGSEINKIAALGHLLTMPLAVICLINATEQAYSEPDACLPNAMTMILYCSAGATMTVAIFLWG